MEWNGKRMGTGRPSHLVRQILNLGYAYARLRSDLLSSKFFCFCKRKTRMKDIENTLINSMRLNRCHITVIF